MEFYFLNNNKHWKRTFLQFYVSLLHNFVTMKFDSFIEEKVDSSVRNETYIFLDIEAALVRGKQHIIEIGAVKWYPNGDLESFSTLVQPYKLKKLSKRIQNLTGIQTEDLLTAPSFKKVINRFIEWSKGDTIFVTFGEFDRKVLEEELSRNHIRNNFLYPIVDYQQKYMIENQIKTQPSLHQLMTEYEVTTEKQHRALNDAITLYKIFKQSNGHHMIENQKTNQFALLLSESKQGENDLDLLFTFITGEILPTKLNIHSIDSIQKSLTCITKEKEIVQEDGTTIKTEYIEIVPDEEIAHFLHEVAQNITDKVLITRSGLKQISRMNRIHQCTLPKTEVMTLQNLLRDAEAVNRFTINGQTIHKYEKKLYILLDQYKHKLISEFKKRNLFSELEVKA